MSEVDEAGTETRSALISHGREVCDGRICDGLSGGVQPSGAVTLAVRTLMPAPEPGRQPTSLLRV
ncbi:hypothetical protein [Streptomyces sp. NPDC048737]|uniref:hypothetical protein n=1 Tax=unclassified Streptomyces TaxID=2593676 RepID=UPI003423CFBE